VPFDSVSRKKYDVGTCIYLIDAYFKKVARKPVLAFTPESRIKKINNEYCRFKEIEEFNAKEIEELNAKLNAQRRAAGTVGPVRQSGSDTDIPPVGSVPAFWVAPLA
jgi:hypothetical protein